MPKSFALLKVSYTEYTIAALAATPVPLEDLQPATGPAALLAHLNALLAECRDQGTRPFAILARHAFIAEALLRSAVACGALSVERLAAFKAWVRTVMGELTAAIGCGEALFAQVLAAPRVLLDCGGRRHSRQAKQFLHFRSI